MPRDERAHVSLEFTVYGQPQPQGSTRAFIPKGWSRPIITAANSKTKPWRQEIAGTVIPLMQSRSLITGPIILKLRFFFERPKSVKQCVQCKTTKPDLDKLIRSVADALTGVVFKDDSQIVGIDAGKFFGSPARVEVEIS